MDILDSMAGKVFKQGVFVLLACVSLLASSISACACSHHQVHSNLKESSCHAHSEMAEMPQADEHTDSSSADQVCICVSKEPAAAAIKSGNQPAGEKASALLAAVVVPLLADTLVLGSETVAAAFVRSVYPSRIALGLLPSRAPPRL